MSPKKKYHSDDERREANRLAVARHRAKMAKENPKPVVEEDPYPDDFIVNFPVVTKQKTTQEKLFGDIREPDPTKPSRFARGLDTNNTVYELGDDPRLVADIENHWGKFYGGSEDKDEE